MADKSAGHIDNHMYTLENRSCKLSVIGGDFYHLLSFKKNLYIYTHISKAILKLPF